MKIYLRLLLVSTRARMNYRLDFLTGMISLIILNTVQLGLIGIIITRFANINGWSIWEIVFLYSLWMLSHSFYSTFFWHLFQMENYIIQGTLDQFLIRPINPLIQLFAREVQYMGVGDALLGAFGIILSYGHLNLQWGVNEFAFFLLTVICGAIIEVSLMWICACISFWTGRSMTAFMFVSQINSLVQQYPVDIFGTWFKVVVSGLIPVAFMNYYPSLFLLGKQINYSAWTFLQFFSPIVALLLLTFAFRLWSMGLKRYTGSGS